MRGILHKSTFLHKLTLPAQILDEERKLTEIFISTFLWCLKGLHKTFSGTTKRCENKNLS